MLPTGDKDGEGEDAPPIPGMLPTTPAAAASAEKAAAAEAAAEKERGPAVSVARLKELKDKARAEIEQRLKDRRKKRRLMRGGDVPSGRRL